MRRALIAEEIHHIPRYMYTSVSSVYVYMCVYKYVNGYSLFLNFERYIPNMIDTASHLHRDLSVNRVQNKVQSNLIRSYRNIHVFIDAVRHTDVILWIYGLKHRDNYFFK